MRTAVVDSWAIVAWIKEESPAWIDVQKLLDKAGRGETTILLSAINAGEIFYALMKGHSDDLAWRFRKLLPTMPITVATPGVDEVWRASELKAKHKISYADAFAADLAITNNCGLYTGDPELKGIRSLHVHWLERDQKK